MQIQLFKPHPALRDFVHGILVSSADLRHLPEEVVCPFPPSPEQYIYFYPNDPIHAQKEEGADFVRKAGSIIVGPQARRVNLQIGKDHLMLGIVFCPGGLYRLLGIPMQKMLDEDYDSYSVLGKEINEIYAGLQEAKNWMEMKLVVESFLLKKLSRLKAMLPFDHAIRELMLSGGLMSIEKTASLGCLSLRQFERQCQQRIGLAPKFFARLIRFSNAYRLKETHEDVNWTQIAHSTGYFDQMHMIRDFKEFTGVTPSLIDTALEATPLRLQSGFRH